MAAVIISAFALALFCFLALSSVCLGTIFAFIYRRYYGLQRSPARDVEAQPCLPSSATAATNVQKSATLTGSSEPHDLAVDPSPKDSGPTACSDEKLDRLADSTPSSPQNDKSTWKRRTLSWVLTDDMQIRFSSLGASIAKAKAKAKERWPLFDSDTSLATMDVVRLSEDVPPTHPKEAPSLSSRKSAADVRSPSSCAEKPTSAAMDPDPSPADAVLAAVENPSRSSTSKEPLPMLRPSGSNKPSRTPRSSASKKSTSNPRPSASKKPTSTSRPSTSKKSASKLRCPTVKHFTSTFRRPTSTTASVKLFPALPGPAPASSASTPTLASTMSTPASPWEPQTPPASTSITYHSYCPPSPSAGSLEVRSTDLNLAALASSEVILASGSLPTCVSGFSDIIGCLDVRGSLIEDLAKTAVHPTLGIGFDDSWLSRAAISLSLGSELPGHSRGTTSVPPKVVDARPRQPTLSTSNIITADKDNAALGDSFISSDSRTACGADAPEQKSDDECERYAALVDALSTTFSIASLRTPGSSRLSAVSASTSPSPSVGHVSDSDLGLDTSDDMSYDASESDFDGFCGSDDEGYKPRPTANPALPQSHSLRQQSALAI